MHHQAGVHFENFTDVKFRDILLTRTGHWNRRLNRGSPSQTGMCMVGLHMNCILTFIYKSLLFWRGSVTIEVTNFHPPVKTSVANSCLKLNSILYKSRNSEANEDSVHCADIEGIDVKPGSANSFGCRTLCKAPVISHSPERVELPRSHYLPNMRAFGLTPTTDITSI